MSHPLALEVSGDRLDRAYLERWLDPLSVRALWDRALAAVERH